MYIFPPVRFVSNALHDQIVHIISECDEVVSAYQSPEINDLAMELCDLIHSAETALRMLAERYDVDVLVVQALVVDKNQKRGYYA